MQVQGYCAKDKTKWDDFISTSKNGTFLFFRDYMEYHSDRFKDYSLIVKDDHGQIVALLPANQKGDILVSHEGLTYGGFVINTKMTTPHFINIFDNVLQYLKEKRFSKFLYKTIPHIYHRIPSEEDLYSLFINKAELIKRDVSSTLLLDQKVPFERNRIRRINKGKKSGLELRTNNDFFGFMTILKNHLQRKYGVKPVHTESEIQLLASRFPENIKLFSAYKEGTIVGGIIMYETSSVAHLQYSAMSEEGKNLGASDFILDYLINEYYVEKKYFDFGISTEKGGKFINVGLSKNKESFGARTIVYDQYEITIKSS